MSIDALTIAKEAENIYMNTNCPLTLSETLQKVSRRFSKEVMKKLLKELYAKQGMNQHKISEKIGCNASLVSYYIKKYGIKRTPKNYNKGWTTEQKQFLMDNVGKMSYKQIANDKLISREITAVKREAVKLGVGDPKFNSDFFSRNALATRLGVDPKTVKKWSKEYGLKSVKRCISEKANINIIKLEDFWKWAKKHKDLINWSKFKEDNIGAEPNWTKEAREEYRKTHSINHGKAYTDEQDRIIVSSYKAGIPLNKIAENLGRKDAASIDSRLALINQQRKVYHHWDKDKEGLERLTNLYYQRMSTREIAKEMNLPFMCVKAAIDRYINKPKRESKQAK